MHRRRLTRTAALSLGLLALATLAAIGPRVYRWLRIEWRAHQCLEELRALARPDGLGDGPMPAWEQALAPRQDGFPVVARALQLTDEGRLLVGMWQATDRVAGKDRSEELLQYLQKSDAETFLRFFILRPRPTEETATAFDDDWPEDWHARDTDRLRPTRAAVQFCRAVLYGDVLEGVVRDDHPRYRARAVDALAAMLPRRDLPPPDAGHARIEPRIVDLLRRVAREEAAGPLGFRAVWRLIERLELCTIGGVLDLELDVVDSLRWVLHQKYRGYPAEFTLAVLSGPFSAAAVLALVHCDRVETLDVLRQLDQIPAWRAAIDAVLLDHNPSLPFPPPKWRPLHAAAGRFLRRTPRDRVLATLFLADLGDAHGVPLLEEAIEAENDPELRLLYKAGLVALGEWKHFAEVRTAFATRAAELTDEKTGEGDDPWAFAMRRLPPASWKAEKGAVEAHPRDLAHLLIRGGDRETLDAVMEHWLNDPSAEPAVELHEVLEPWTFGSSRSDYQRIRARLDGDRFRILPPPPDRSVLEDRGVLGKQLTSELERELLVSYWQEIASRAPWNRESRRFVVAPTDFAEWARQELGRRPLPVPVVIRWLAAMPASEGAEAARKLAEALTTRYIETPASQDHPDETLDVYHVPSYDYPFRHLDTELSVSSWGMDGLQLRSDMTGVRLDDRGGYLTTLLALADSMRNVVSGTLVAALKSGERDLRLLAVAALERLGTEAAAALPAVAKCLDDEDWIVAKEAARSMGRIDPRGARSLPLLAAVVNNAKRPSGVRAIAARVLAGYGRAAAARAPTLESIVRDAEAPAMVRAQAARALWKIDAREEVVGELAEIVRSSEGAARTVAAMALGEMGTTAERAVPVLVDVLRGPAPPDAPTAQLRSRPPRRSCRSRRPTRRARGPSRCCRATLAAGSRIRPPLRKAAPSVPFAFSRPTAVRRTEAPRTPGGEIRSSP